MNNVVESNRVIYTPSEFARSNLLYIQEVGKSISLKKHTSSRNYLDSFLFFIVINGCGTLKYDGKTHKLDKGNIVFINCNKPYSHTSDNWTIKWVHFNGNNLGNIYNKFISRGGKAVISTSFINEYDNFLEGIYRDSVLNEYTADMNIYDKLTSLLSLLMSETIYSSPSNKKHKYDIKVIKNYLDNNYLSNISLSELTNKFYINKFYLTRLFKETYSKTINEYIVHKRIDKSKEMLRYTDKTVAQISMDCGFKDPNYFSRKFKDIEGITPKNYKKMW